MQATIWQNLAQVEPFQNVHGRKANSVRREADGAFAARCPSAPGAGRVCGAQVRYSRMAAGDRVVVCMGNGRGKIG